MNVHRCRFIHDIPSYLSAKPKDIHFSSNFTFSDTPPFVPLTPTNPEEESSTSIDPTTICPVYHETGYCRHGLKCRFLGGHVRTDPESGDLVLLQDDEKMARTAVSSKEVNFVGGDVLKLLRSKKVCMFLERIIRGAYVFLCVVVPPSDRRSVCERSQRRE